MKKILSVLVVVSLLFAISVPAFAGAQVDALTDEKQKEIATLVISSIKDKGRDPSSVGGRETIAKDVVNGIKDYSTYKSAYDEDSTAIGIAVLVGVNAANQDLTTDDKGFSNQDAKFLTSEINKQITNKIAPAETTTGSTEQTTEIQPAGEKLQNTVKLLESLPADKREQTLVFLVGNNILTPEDAKSVVYTLYKDGKVSMEERDKLYAAISSPEASTGIGDKVFDGYTPADLGQLFRGFGDSIGTMTSALADLFRKVGSSSGNGSANEGSTGTNPNDIPATGDYAIVSVAGVAALAGVALILTRKKHDK